eukprot:5865901-Prymnesium_polylepis.1
MPTASASPRRRGRSRRASPRWSRKRASPSARPSSHPREWPPSPCRTRPCPRSRTRQEELDEWLAACQTAEDAAGVAAVCL